MSTWRSLPSMAVGMVEIAQGKANPYCEFAGHHWVWDTDVIACKRARCRHTNAGMTERFLAAVGSLEGQTVIADELRKRRAA